MSAASLAILGKRDGRKREDGPIDGQVFRARAISGLLS